MDWREATDEEAKSLFVVGRNTVGHSVVLMPTALTTPNVGITVFNAAFSQFAFGKEYVFYFRTQDGEMCEAAIREADNTVLIKR